MIELKNYDAENIIPYYVHCQYSLIHEKLLNEGYISFLSLHLNAQLFSIQTYSRNEEMTKFKINEWESTLLGYKNREEYLGINVKIGEFSDFNEGIKYINDSIKNNKLCIVGGSCYYLPYSYDYQDQSYINEYPRVGGIYNHWVGICGIADDKVKLRDTTPKNLVEWIDIENFKKYWMGDKNISELINIKGINNLLCYGYIDIDIIKKLSMSEVKELFLTVLNTIAFEYLSGKTIKVNDVYVHHGKKAFIRIIDDLKTISNLKDRTEKLVLINEVIQQMKFSRYFLRDLIKDIANLYPNKFDGIYNDIVDIVEKIEKISNYLFLEIKRRKNIDSFIGTTIDRLNEIYNMENIFYKKIRNILKKCPLLDKEARQK